MRIEPLPRSCTLLFNACQEPHEDIGSFALRQQGHFLRLKREDSRGIHDENILLRDHLIEGLRDAAIMGEFRTKILLNNKLTFEHVKAELLLREHAYGEIIEHAQCLTTRGEKYSNNGNVKNLEQIKYELREEMTKQMALQFNELSQSLIKEIRAELHQNHRNSSDWNQHQYRPMAKGESRPRASSN